MFEVGVTRHSMYRPDPPIHLLVTGGLHTWCGGALAMIGNTLTQRRCSKCLALARQDLARNKVADDEPTDLDWYLGRHVERVS